MSERSIIREKNHYERNFLMAEQRTTTTAQPQHHTEEVIVPARLHHINLKAFKFDEMREFYTALIGIHPNAEVDTFGWYTYDSANHRLALMHMPEFTPRVPGSAVITSAARKVFFRPQRSDNCPRIRWDAKLTKADMLNTRLVKLIDICSSLLINGRATLLAMESKPESAIPDIATMISTFR